MAECSVTNLVDESCSNQFKQAAQNETMFRAIMLQLLCNISAGGGGGGSSNIVGSGSPEGAETADPGVMYLDEDINSLWMKKTGTGTTTGWVQLIA